MVHILDVQLWMAEQVGATYVFGAETADPPPPHIEATDCSEYIQGGCNAAGVSPKMPDGAYYQWQHCKKHGLTIPVERALKTNGATLYIGDLTGVGRQAVTHTAMSLGDGRTLEARGKRWKVGIFAGASTRGWSAAGLIPGVDYTPRQPLRPAPPTTEDDVLGKDIHTDRRGAVIAAYFSALGREPKPSELAPGAEVDQHVLVLVHEGYEAMQLAIAHSKEGRAHLARG